MTTLVLALAVVTGAQAPSPARTVEGKVSYATATTAYLDAGSREGLAAGMTVALYRGSGSAGTCTVREVGDHFAACTGHGLHGGERFAVQTAVPAAPAVAQLAPIPSDEEQARRLAAVEATPVAMVEAAATAKKEVAIPQLPLLEADLGYGLWATNSGSATSGRLQLDVRVSGLEAFAGFRLFADARLMQWAPYYSAFAPGGSTQLLVYDLELAQREPGRSWTAAFGRVIPWFIPGATVMDGAQAGFKVGSVELGAFGGLLPNPYNTEPQTNSYTGGVYANFEAPIGKTLLSGGARVAVVQDQSVMRHYEGELALNYWVGSALSLAGDLRVGGGDLKAPDYIDAGRITISTRPWEPLTIGAGFSYWGLLTPDQEPQAIWPGPSRRADANVGIEAAKWITISALGGWIDDLVSNLSHTYLGPEVLFPHLLAGLSLGYLRDLGWLEGGNAWAQLAWQASQSARLTGRLSWYQTAANGSSTATNELGATISGTVGLNRWLALRFSVLMRVGLDNGQGSIPFGTSSELFLVGNY